MPNDEKMQADVKQAIINTIKGDDCFVSSVEWADLSHCGAEQSMTIKFVRQPEVEDTAFEDAMGVIE